MATELVIFDCDGVLVDSEPLANGLLRDALAVVGLELTVAETRARFVGLSMTKVMGLVEDEISEKLPAGWLDDLQARTFEGFRRDLRPVSGIRAAINAIAGRGIAHCVASSGSLEKMSVSLGTTDLASLFGDRIFSADMVARGKPAPDLFLFAASQMGVLPENTVVVEDSIPGLKAALSAGMAPIAYLGDPLAPRVEAAGLGVSIIEDMQLLPDLI